MKYFNYKTYNFSKFFKKINFKRYNFLKFAKDVKFTQFSPKKTYKYLIDLQYEYFKIFKQKVYRYYKTSLIYLAGTTLALILTYLIIPFFYNYDKSNLERLICIDFEIKCNIEGKIYYNFFPTPRLVLKNLQIYSSKEAKNTLAEIEKVEVIIPLKDLYKKSKDDFNKITLEKAKLYINYEKIDQYKNLFLKKKKN